MMWRELPTGSMILTKNPKRWPGFRMYISLGNNMFVCIKENENYTFVMDDDDDRPVSKMYEVMSFE